MKTPFQIKISVKVTVRLLLDVENGLLGGFSQPECGKTRILSNNHTQMTSLDVAHPLITVATVYITSHCISEPVRSIIPVALLPATGPSGDIQFYHII